VVAKDREIRNTKFFGAQQRQRGRRRRRFETDGKKANVTIGFVLRDAQGVERRVDHANVGSAGLKLERCAPRSRNAHHIAERGQDGTGMFGDRETVVDAPHG